MAQTLECFINKSYLNTDDSSWASGKNQLDKSAVSDGHIFTMLVTKDKWIVMSPALLSKGQFTRLMGSSKVRE
jgi:hypothetical protein